MIAYYETATKRFISYNPFTMWEVQGEPSNDMKKAALDYYQGLQETACNTDLADSNLIVRVERTEYREDEKHKAFDYTVTAYQQIDSTEFTITKGETE